MTLRAIQTTLTDVLLLAPPVHADERGFFLESFNAREFAQATGSNATFVQDNHSCSYHGVLRGLHYQIDHPQGKLVRATRGRIFDVVVDLRKCSPEFGRWLGVELSGDEFRQLWIPAGFAHGFVVLSDVAEIQYKTTDYWYPEHERSLAWNDPALGIDWAIDFEPVLATRDAVAGALAEVDLFD